MGLQWIREQPPYWDSNKAKTLGDTPEGTFDPQMRHYAEGDLLPGDWWRVELGGEVLGYGWMDISWGDAEILLAVDSEARNRGVGSFILDNLLVEARLRGLNYVHNVVRPEHPERAVVESWLEQHSFSRLDDGRLVRAVVPRAMVDAAVEPRRGLGA